MRVSERKRVRERCAELKYYFSCDMLIVIVRRYCIRPEGKAGGVDHVCVAPGQHDRLKERAGSCAELSVLDFRATYYDCH